MPEPRTIRVPEWLDADDMLGAIANKFMDDPDGVLVMPLGAVCPRCYREKIHAYIDIETSVTPELLARNQFKQDAVTVMICPDPSCHG